MKESVLQHIWQYRLYDSLQSDTYSPDTLQVIEPGRLNRNAGPDFTDTLIRFGHITWAGNVEVHLRASDWSRHGHHLDPAYNNVILHVVEQNDTPCFTADGREVPAVRLTYSATLLQNIGKLLTQTREIGCAAHIQSVSRFTVVAGMERQLVERLEKRTELISNLLSTTANDREEAFYILMMRAFGAGTNAEPFERLARSVSLRVLSRHTGRISQIEALLFGQAGFLAGDSPDDYHAALRQEYDFLARKYGLTPVAHPNWRFMRMRPHSFPTLRIAQAAALINAQPRLPASLIAAVDTAEVFSCLEAPVSPYWQEHYHFGKSAKKADRSLGSEIRKGLIINALVPFLFDIGLRENRQHLMDKASAILQTLPPENNRIIRSWREIGIEPENAAHSQALYHLMECYCKPRQCLSCPIGHALILGWWREREGS